MGNVSEPAKEAMIDELVLATVEAQKAKGPNHRQLHSKSHGLLRGEFVVEPDLPESLRVGILADARVYPAWIRFSNGAGIDKRGSLKPDSEPDVRGLAIKLMDVPGQKVLDDEQYTQDFVMVTHPVFFIQNLRQYAEFFKVISGQGTPEIMSSLERPFRITKEMRSKPLAPLLSLTYWSTTPYRLGATAIKFLVQPTVKISNAPALNSLSAECLREQMVQYLSEEKGDASFDFMIQPFVNEDKTPIEDPTVEWVESDAVPVKVATLRIPSQKFDFAERRLLDLGLSFTPWHTLPEHEPLGEVNLARKRVYMESTQFRRQTILNRCGEPQPYDVLADDPEE